MMGKQTDFFGTLAFLLTGVLFGMACDDHSAGRETRARVRAIEERLGVDAKQAEAPKPAPIGQFLTVPQAGPRVR